MGYFRFKKDASPFCCYYAAFIAYYCTKSAFTSEVVKGVKQLLLAIQGRSLKMGEIEKQITGNNNAINIDGGCVYSMTHLSKLVSLEINTMTIVFAG